MMSPYCEFRMQVWHMLHVARWKYRKCKTHHLHTIRQICWAVSSQLRHILTTGKKLVKQQYLFHTSSEYCELRLTNGWDQLVSLGHPSKFQRVLGLGLVTAPTSTSLSGGQPNFAWCLAISCLLGWCTVYTLLGADGICVGEILQPQHQADH